MFYYDSQSLIKKFKSENANRIVETLEPVLSDVNPQKIIGIGYPYEYPEILEDYKMKQLKKSYASEGWNDEFPHTLELLEFPDGTFVVSGNGNHRAVLAKEELLDSIKANVHKVVYCD